MEDTSVAEMTSSNLVVPLVLWGKNAPTHCICSILMTPDEKHIVTGCNDGQVIVWDLTNDWKVYPHHMLLGHTAAVTSLTLGSNNPEKPYIITSSDNGEMCLWDLRDGRCIENTKMSVVHTKVQAHQMIHCRDIRLICNGYYPDIHIVHPWSLEILYSLTSRIQPDWISALCVLRPVNREDDVVVAISNSGVVKVWTLPGGEGKPSQTVFEDESKHIRCLNAQTLRCCAYNQRTVLIVCSKYWQVYDTTWVMGKPSSGLSQSVASASGHHGQQGIYDAGDFSLLCSESSRRGERWCGGEFIGIDKIIVWSTEGKGYLFKLPTNLLRGKAVHSTNPVGEVIHKPGDPSCPRQSGPQAYTVLDVYMEKSLECSPAMIYFYGRRERENKLILRGDSDGRIVIWTIPNVHDSKMKLCRQESFDKLPAVRPKCCTSLQEAWERAIPTTEGIIDQLNYTEERQLQITATIYIPTQGRLVCGRDDGSIVIVPAITSIVLQLLQSRQSKDSLPHQLLQGHSGRVNTLLYPYNDSHRYEPNLLVSGGVDFTVCLWDVFNGTKLHTFCVHGGEITQLVVPPETCNPRILPCVCSVASDHSLALLSLRERKCVMSAARQLFPIATVKWRPHDDFVIIGTTDGTVYVWQMETGHLDRVVHGVTAEEILGACDEKMEITVTETLVNPTISIAQAFKRHNLATFKNLANQHLKKAQDVLQQPQTPASHPGLIPRHQMSPLVIQGLKTNTKDPDSHIVYFDTEALIIQLLSEEYSHLSPGTLESLGFLTSIGSQDPQAHLTDSQKKLADFISKVKDKAENVGQKLQEKAENAGFKPISPMLQRKGGGEGHSASPTGGAGPRRPPRPPPPKLGLQETSEASLVMQTTQLFMSLIHAWGRDPDLDKLCTGKLGLLCPKRPVPFGLLSRGGHMSVLLPGWQQRFQTVPGAESSDLAVQSATAGHWQISSAVTTNHLLSVISTANTLMSMTNATFQSRRVGVSPPARASASDLDMTLQAQTKQGWSLLAALHCVLLPDLIGREQYKPPQLEMLARRWQDRCLEIREAAQALLLAELRRIGTEGRKKVVEDWSPFLPSYVDPALSILVEQQQQPGGQTMMSNPASGPGEEEENEDDNMIGGSDSPVHRVSLSYESRRKQATAIVMMGVIGAEFGAAMDGGTKVKVTEDPHKKNVADGFGLVNYTHARHTSKALTFLLLQPPSARLPAFTPIRRAAVDLLGRGFTVWEPYLDVSAVLLGLLELCVDGDKLVPSVTFGLPLSPRADACRTSRHTLSLIATARPPAFIITMAKEVARYNALAQNTQAQHNQLQNSVLVKAKSEILRIIELLVDKIPNDVVELLVEVMDIAVHCLDPGVLKAKGLQETFPAVCKFTNVSYCSNTRRICVGARNGGVAFYDLKQTKCQILPAHSGPVTAVCFSTDGKYLASYSCHDNKLLFWQTASTSLFNLGSQQTKCVKAYTTHPLNLPPNTNPLKMVKLVWVDNRTAVLLCADGSETRYRV